MRNTVWVMVIAWLIISCQDADNSIKREQTVSEDSISVSELLKSVASSIGSNEDPAARYNYEFNLTKNPTTNIVPFGIRQRELEYAKSLPKVSFDESEARPENDWISAGPDNVGGRTRSMVFDIRDAQVALAGGVTGGIWKSEDGGASWRRTSHPLLVNNVTTIAQDTRPGKEDTWYYGTGELRGNSAAAPGAPMRGDGLFRSTDNGETWEPIFMTSFGQIHRFNTQFQYTWKIVLNSRNLEQDEILLASYGAIIRSVDGGDSWEVVLGENVSDLEDLNESISPFYTDLVMSETGIFFATLSSFSSSETYDKSGVYASLDGVTWDKIDPTDYPSSVDRTVIAIKGGDSGLIYFLSDHVNEENQEEPRLFVCAYERDGSSITTTWQDRSSSIPDYPEAPLGEFDTQTGYNLSVAIHPDNNQIVFLGATNIYRSTNGFINDKETTWIGGYDIKRNGRAYPNHHPDIHGIIFDPEDADAMYTISDGGIHYTFDNLKDSVDWIPLNNNFITSQFYTISMQKDQATNTLLGGLQDNGTYGTFGGASWNDVLVGDGGYTYITDQQKYYYISFQYGQTFRVTVDNTMDITSFARVDPVDVAANGLGLLFVNPYVIDPANQNIMYLAGADYIWRNDNLAQVPAGSQEPTSAGWTRLDETQTLFFRGGEVVRFDGQISALELAKGEEDILYYGTNTGRLFKLINPIDDDSEPTEITGEDFSNGYILNLSVNPIDQNELLVVFSNYEVLSVFRSTDGGESFESISGNLEQVPDGTGNGPSVRWSEIVPLQNGTKYFLGTSVGLVSTTSLNGVNTIWEQEGPEQIGSSLVVMTDYRLIDGKLVVATHGNGIFSTIVEGAQLISPTPTSVEEFVITEAYPNPFSEEINIYIDVPETDIVQVNIYNATGQLVKNILHGEQFSGSSKVTWDGTNYAGYPVNDGIYIYSIRYQDQQLSGRVMVNR